MEIVHVARTGDYERYEALTLAKEQYEKEAEYYYFSYVQEFGELSQEAFELKIDCIALKKEIALYIAAKNSGREITQDEINAYLEEHMTAYKMELERMIQERAAINNSKLISNYELEQVKKIYRRLAKLLHPDISPLTEKYPSLSELFNRVILAYKCNDLKELQKLEVLINKELEDNGIDNFAMAIPNISERIEELEEDIDAIVNSEPYTLKAILESGELTEKKRQEFLDEIKNYKEYKAELSEKLKKIKEGD